MDEIINIKCSPDFFMSKLYLSNHPENETVRICKTLVRFIKCQHDIFGSLEFLNDHTIRTKPLNDLADDCLMSVALFSKHIQSRSQRYGSPSVEWYVYVGTRSFEKLDYKEIAQNYNFWTSFISEHIFA